MPIKRVVASISMVLFVVLGTATPAAAHTLRTDQGLSVALHISPSDKVIATRPATLQFSFEDVPATFSLAECGCRVHITDNHRSTLSASKLSKGAKATELTGQVAFPRAGNYSVSLTGFTTPGHSGQFSLVYPVHVQPVPAAVSRSIPTAIYALIVACAVAMIAVVWYYYRPRMRHKKD